MPRLPRCGCGYGRGPVRARLCEMGCRRASVQLGRPRRRAGPQCGGARERRARQRGRHDVDLVARLAHQRAHLRLGGFAARPQRGRLHVAGSRDDLGHLRPHRLGAPRAQRQPALQPQQAVDLPGDRAQRSAHRGQLRHGGVTGLGVGDRHLGVLDSDPHPASHSGGCTPAQLLRCGPPRVALPPGRSQREGRHQPAGDHVAPHEAPAPADVAAGEDEGRHQGQRPDDGGDQQELDRMGHEGHPPILRGQALEIGRYPCPMEQPSGRAARGTPGGGRGRAAGRPGLAARDPFHP